jgi:hypothetical protein
VTTLGGTFIFLEEAEMCYRSQMRAFREGRFAGKDFANEKFVGALKVSKFDYDQKVEFPAEILSERDFSSVEEEASFLVGFMEAYWQKYAEYNRILIQYKGVVRRAEKLFQNFVLPIFRSDELCRKLEVEVCDKVFARFDRFYSLFEKSEKTFNSSEPLPLIFQTIGLKEDPEMNELDLVELVKLGEKAGRKDFGEFHRELLRKMREGEEISNDIYFFQTEIAADELALKDEDLSTFLAGATLGVWKGLLAFADLYFEENPDIVFFVAESKGFNLDGSTISTLHRMEKMYGEKYNPFVQIPQQRIA